MMLEFDKFLAVAEAMLSDRGCPWVKEQTFETTKPYLLEEMHELLEAIDLNQPEKIKEELGDCFYILVFLAKYAEKTKTFTLQEVLHAESEKLIRRHPHVFEDAEVSSPEDVLRKWEVIKKKEGKKSPIAGIPPTLPSLARAQKIISKLRRLKQEPPISSELQSEEELGKKLWALVQEAESRGFDAESALRTLCLRIEE